ncbi:integrin alpha-8-like, partial [Empidonax traillii]|uniref:integrin alpha-8-like n=1 Tax=Empidonax traillii TaxID=164674 RepID=UPI000FFD52C6
MPGLRPHFGVAMGLLRALLLLGGLHLPPTLGLLQEPPREYAGPPGSYFGFALDFLMEEGRPSVAVGAPRANTSQPGVAQPGAVFLCSWPPGETPCRPLPIDTAGDETETQGTLEFHTYKSHQWLGASVTSWDGKLVACAPLQHWNADGTLVLGAPGGYYFTGLLYSVEVNTILSRFHGTSLLWLGTPGRPTVPVSLEYEDGYRGYSVAVGEFDGDPRTKEYVVGVPNKRDTKGEVEIFTAGHTLRRLRGIDSEQVASYFGHTVAVADANGDG